MAVYITLTVVVVLFSLFCDNRNYIKLHIGAGKPGGRISQGGGKPAAGQAQAAGRGSFITGGLSGKRERQQAVNFCVAVAVFLLLMGVSACRIAVGNDYWVYRFQFNLIMQGRHVSYEWGFNLVVWLVQSLFGYDNYIPVFAVFSAATAFFFVKALYDQAEWFAASVFLLMTGGYYFSSLNSVRYYFVLAVALYAMKYAISREYGKFILWILFAACFHKSILVVIPVYMAARWLSGRKAHPGFYLACGLFMASLVLFRDFYRRIIFYFYPFYEGSAFDRIDVSWSNIAKCAGVLALSLIFYRGAVKDNVRNRFYFFLNLAGLATYTFGSFIPEVSRIGYYFIVSQIFLLPGVLLRIEGKRRRALFTAGTAAVFAGYFGLFLRSASATDVRLLPYLNWIFN